jgi:hypothetical protein
MKKLIAFVAVVGFAMAFVACGKKAETATETPATEEVAPAAADSTVVDSTATDSTAAQ